MATEPASTPTVAPNATSSAPIGGERERFGSRLGFILISAGCAIGLGNVWRFPYITGEYGGAAFLVLYLAFLLVLGLTCSSRRDRAGTASSGWASPATTC